MSMSVHKLNAYKVFDLRHSALKRTPRFVFEFVDRGEDEVALRINRAAFERIKVNPGTIRIDPSKALSFLAAALILSVSLDLDAQVYQTKPIRLICGFAAGGGSDTIARIVAQGLSAQTHQPVVVENRLGAGGSVATEAVVRSPPDGYTALLGSTSQISINPNLYGDLKYSPIKDLAPIRMVATMPLVLVVHPSLPVHSVKDLIALAGARPSEINYGSAGIASTTHLAMELFRANSAINVVHIPYKGTAPAFTDLLGGEIQIMFSTLTAVLPMLQAVRLRALAVTSSARSSYLPSVPTMREAGSADMEIQFWLGLFFPAGTPTNIVERLSHETAQVLKSREMIGNLKKQGAEPGNLSSVQFTEFLQADAAKWAKAVKLSGARAK